MVRARRCLSEEEGLASRHPCKNHPGAGRNRNSRIAGLAGHQSVKKNRELQGQ